MSILNPVVMLALGAALLAGNAAAIDPPPRQGATRDASRSEPPQPQPEASTDPQGAVKAAQSDSKSDTKTDTDTRSETSTDAKGRLVKPTDPPHSGAAPAKGSRKQPVKPPVKRRAVRAQLDDEQTTYRPTLATPAPALRAPTPQSTMPQTSLPSGPVILNGCPGGHCSDQSGQRYNPVGTTLVSPQGRLCSNNGISVSCY